MTTIDLAAHPDFIRLQTLQISQISDMNEFRSSVNNNFLELSKQMAEICTSIKCKPPDKIQVLDCPKNSEHSNYLSVVDLDKPKYAATVIDNPDYIPAKHIKVEMPRFDGKEAEEWIFSVRRYFIFNKIPEDQKLLIVSFHLDGTARKWFAWMEASNMLTDWKNFVEAVVRKFTSIHYSLPGGKLSKLCQDGTVSEYQAKFQELGTRVLGLPEYFVLEMYISGLKEEIQIEVLRDKPSDIHEAFDLSLLIKSQTSGSRVLNHKPASSKYLKGSSFIPKADFTTTKLGEPAPNSVPKSLPVFKRLSPAERRERTSKCLCFNCDDKFVPGHKCKGKMFRLSADESCLWEVEDTEEHQDEEEIEVIIPEGQTKISFHAFEGHINANTIRLDGYIKFQSVSVLVDTGSTHNFMQVEVAQALKLTIHLIIPFKVSTGSGEKLVCDKVCRNVEIRIQGTAIQMDIFLLPMAGANMVIGIQGLKTLGAVTFDFSSLQMEFWWRSKKVSWQGSPWISEDPLTIGQLKSLQASTQEAYL